MIELLLDPHAWLALAFLLLIGVALVADGFALHVPRSYFAMAFAGAVEAFSVVAQPPAGEALSA